MLNENSPIALVVDDDPMILLNACDILEGASFQCFEAICVSEALQRLEEAGDRISLLFTDVQLGPGPDGFALAAETAARWPGIKIVIASGQATPAAGDLPDGAVFIGKPFSADVVRDHIERLMGNRPAGSDRSAQTGEGVTAGVTQLLPDS